LQKDRLIVVSGLCCIALLAWGYMWHEARIMGQTGVCACMGMKMAGPDTQGWSASDLIPLFLMWAEMMVAMMIPSVAPAVLTFATVSRKRQEEQRPFVPAAVFLSGYLAVWTLFSALAAGAQWILHGVALLSSQMVTTSPVIGGMLLVAAGVFQFGPMKSRCLEHCRTPLSFLLSNWKEGWTGAFMMGVKHGAYCTGCCWLLMLLLFVAGVMNMWWIAAISLFVLIEKLGARINRWAGVALIGWGLIVLMRPLFV
jgi:predicted metal-binding membrane protein